MNSEFTSEIPDEEWVEGRKNYIGGSDCAAILGKSSYKTPLQVWLRKQGHIKPVDSTPIMEFGNIFEPFMADYFTHVTGLKTRRVNEPIVHKTHDFLRANIDRQILNGQGVEGTGVLELKTTTSHRMKKLAGEYPIEWEYQIQHYLGITGYQYAYLFIFERDTCEFYEPLKIRRDDELISENTEKLIQWWQEHMVAGTQPKPINGEDLLLLYPGSSDGKVVEATPTTLQLYRELTDVRNGKSELAAVETAIKNKLKKELGDSERLVFGGDTLVSWKSQIMRRLDTSRFREEQPEMYSRYLKETNTRRFTVK